MKLKPSDQTNINITITIRNTQLYEIEIDTDYLQNLLKTIAIGYINLSTKPYKIINKK